MEEIKNSILVGQAIWTWEQDPFHLQNRKKIYYTVTGKYGKFFTAERQAKSGYTVKTSFLYSQVLTGEVRRVV